MKNITAKLLASAACLFLALPALGFELAGRVTVQVVNVRSENGVYVPVARLIDASGSHQDIAIGEQGLTISMLYDRKALSAWVTTQLPVATDGNAAAPVEVTVEDPPVESSPPVEVVIPEDPEQTCIAQEYHYWNAENQACYES